MKIVLVSPEYPPQPGIGGIGTNTASLAPALSALGHDVVVVTRGAASRSTEHDVTVVRLHHRSIPLPGRLRPVADRLTSRLRIAAEVRRHRPDVVHAAEWEAEAWAYARIGSAPVVTRLATPTYLVDELNDRPTDRLVGWLERDQTRRSAAVYAPTRAIADRVARDWGLDRGRIENIPNAIDMKATVDAARPPQAGLLPSGGVVFVGRLERRKGIDVLGQALAQVLPDHPEVAAVLIGSETRDGALDQAKLALRSVHDRVHLTGALSRAEALAVLATGRVAVFPSRWESFGYVVVEALALGVPVIATDVGGFSEIISHDEDGLLVAPGEPESLAAAIRRVLEEPGLAERLRTAGLRRSGAFDIASVAPRVAGLLERTAAPVAPIDAGIHRGGYRRHFRPDASGDPFYRLYEAKREAVVATLEGPALSVLDAGGGYGRVSAQLAATHRVTLCDLSAEMLAEASHRQVRADLVQADARRLPFPDAAFDAVVALDLLVHLPHVDEGVRELLRVLRPGGRLLVDSTNASPWWVLAYPSYVNWRPRRLLRTLRHHGVLPEWTTVVRHQRQGELRRVLEQAGARIDGMDSFGPGWCPKWHLWHARRA